MSSEVIRRKASVTCCAVAPPPTSRKLAGDPPCNLMMSIVAMARPAPFTEVSNKHREFYSTPVRDWFQLFKGEPEQRYIRGLLTGME